MGGYFMITEHSLTQYRALRYEIKHDEDRIRALQLMHQPEFQYGTRVTHSAQENSVSSYVEYLDEIEHLLVQNKTRCAKELSSILKFIGNIPSSHLREIFKLRVLDSCTWSEVARRLGRPGDGSTERKLALRYLKESA